MHGRAVRWLGGFAKGEGAVNGDQETLLFGRKDEVLRVGRVPQCTSFWPLSLAAQQDFKMAPIV
jgi:hypothetical protein